MVRTTLALDAQLGWLVYQIDVKSAFLNDDLQREVYVCQLEGFISNEGKRKVYKLKKALYDLNQAPQAWYSEIDSFFQEQQFRKSDNEPTLYVKMQGNSDFLVVCLYVDDIIYMGSCESVVF